MDYIAVEKKWRKIWEETGAHRFDFQHPENKYYIMAMLPYPSGANLHLGHWYNYAPTDTFARYKKMRGKNVFHPIGFDSFGLPAENYAIKTGIHPQDSTYKNIETMRRQLSEIGATFDTDSSLTTSDPEYYKWTQWLFLQFFKAGLAYRKVSQVNWCDSCNTVIANEQVVDGECERCGTPVARKNMKQWFFRITKYAEELLSELDALDWPEKTKLMQKNWIGKSTGGEIIFKSESGDAIPVFTTRADTLFGVTFLAVAPEHPLADKLTTPAQKAAVEEYKLAASRQSDIERLSTAKEKTGVPTGSYCINPANGARVPIFAADYVLGSYGTGAVMGVPAHDERDFVFAKKYDLPVVRVINSPDGKNAPEDLPFCGYGVMTDSGIFSGVESEKGRVEVVKRLEKEGAGALTTNYRLRDWSISRQRYWGCPIPIIICPKCGDVAVPESDLPVKLPYDVNVKPTGQSPLAEHKDFKHVTCPKCGGQARREADTMDTFVCSSWYYLRYADAHNAVQAFDPVRISKMLPVDKYVGGAEHACMHLLYARFFTKALRDLGYLNFGEPFLSLVHQGTILGTDGQKMSKSKGNVINPDSYVFVYGSDIFRLYLMFGFSFIEGGPWSDDGIKSMSRFIERVERLVEKYKGAGGEKKPSSDAEREVEFTLHNTIKKVSEDIESFSFNTCLARVMELLNALTKYDSSEKPDGAFLKDALTELVKILAPFAPHLSEEFYRMLGGAKKSVFLESYPVFDPKKLQKSEAEYAVQLNSKIKTRVTLRAKISIPDIEAAVKAHPEISELLKNQTVKKTIVIPEKLINFIVDNLPKK